MWFTLEERYKEQWSKKYWYVGKKKVVLEPIGYTVEEVLGMFNDFETKEINELTLNRFVMGALRYNMTRAFYVNPIFKLTESIGMKLELYKRDGNQEHLLDLINYAKLEIINKQHPLAHFNSVDDGEHAIER